MTRDEAERTLGDCRRQIDEIDRRILELLNERTRVVERIGSVKKQQAMPVYEPKREDEVFRNVVDNNPGPISAGALRRIYERILDEMRTLQKMRNTDPGDGPGS